MADGLKLAAEAERGARAKSPSTYVQLCAKLGPLLDTKAVAYGDSAANAGRMLELLYPKGVATHQYRDALLVVRILDKLSRIAQRGADGKDKGGESPWQDIAGYGVIGWKLDEAP